MRDEAEIRLDTDFPPPTTPRLPGMIEIYHPPYSHKLSGLLFVHPDRSWRAGAQRMCRINYRAALELRQHLDERWYGFDPSPNRSFGPLDFSVFVSKIISAYIRMSRRVGGPPGKAQLVMEWGLSRLRDTVSDPRVGLIAPTTSSNFPPPFFP